MEKTMIDSSLSTLYHLYQNLINFPTEHADFYLVSSGRLHVNYHVNFPKSESSAVINFYRWFSTEDKEIDIVMKIKGEIIYSATVKIKGDEKRLVTRSRFKGAVRMGFNLLPPTLGWSNSNFCYVEKDIS